MLDTHGPYINGVLLADVRCIEMNGSRSTSDRRQDQRSRLDRDSLLERVARGRADDLNKNIVLLVSAEQRDAAYGHVKLKLTATDAIVWMTSLDEAGNCSNTCGR